MTFDDYLTGVIKTWNRDVSYERQIENAIYGLIGETGEFVEYFKKMKFHGMLNDIDYEKKELGDILYYLTVLMHLRGYSLRQVARANHDKLAARYPDGFVTGGGIR